jgi:hypothetical protein
MLHVGCYAPKHETSRSAGTAPRLAPTRPVSRASGKESRYGREGDNLVPVGDDITVARELSRRERRPKVDLGSGKYEFVRSMVGIGSFR